MSNQVPDHSAPLSGNRIDEKAERVKQATSSAVASTKEAVDRAAGAASSVADRLNEHVDALSEKGDELRAIPENWMAGARDYVREHPLGALGIALAAGYLFSMMMRDK